MKYDVRAKRLELSTLIDIKGQAQEVTAWLPENFITLPELPNTAFAQGNYFTYWIGQDHWLLRSPINLETDLIEKINISNTPDHISAVVVSDTMVFFELSGPDAKQIISIASPLDTHESVFPKNGVTFTEAFGLKALLIRGENGFELGVDRSYADTFEDYLRRAGAGFN